MSVWFCIPSIRPGGGTIPAWQAKGYRLAVLRQGDAIGADLEIPTQQYRGWGASINELAKAVLAADPAAEWLVGGGDDTLPDPHDPAMIAAQCTSHFGGTFGIMQPIGDLMLWPGSRVDRFAGSPWMGRAACERLYGGQGPFFGEYHHMFGDEELQCVAERLGIFWQRPDLIHQHMHWGRKPGRADRRDIPDFLQYVNSHQHWDESSALFQRRRAAGFPGHEPIEVCV